MQIDITVKQTRYGTWVAIATSRHTSASVVREGPCAAADAAANALVAMQNDGPRPQDRL